MNNVFLGLIRRELEMLLPWEKSSMPYSSRFLMRQTQELKTYLDSGLWE